MQKNLHTSRENISKSLYQKGLGKFKQKFERDIENKEIVSQNRLVPLWNPFLQEVAEERGFSKHLDISQGNVIFWLF